MTKKEAEILAAYHSDPSLTQQQIGQITGAAGSYISHVLRKHGFARGRTRDTKQRVLKLYESNLSPQEIAERLEIVRPYVVQILKELGHPVPKISSLKYDLPMDEIADRYRAGESCGEIAADYGIPNERIRRRLRAHGIPRRSAKIAVPKGKKNVFYKNGNTHLRKEDKNMHYYRRQSYEVAAICLGQPLPQGTVIHHMDEDWHNNDPKNLYLFPNRKDHSRYHMQLLRLQKKDLEVDTIQLALENGAKQLPKPPHPIQLPTYITSRSLEESRLADPPNIPHQLVF